MARRRIPRAAGTYEVGYGKPPKRTRFKSGQSGNPKGRPKSTNNLSTDVKAVLNKRVTVNDQGRQRTESTQKVALLRLREKALKGDGRALDLFLDLAHRFNNDPPADGDGAIAEDDRAILNDFVRRVQTSAGDETAATDQATRPKGKVKRVQLKRKRPKRSTSS